MSELVEIAFKELYGISPEKYTFKLNYSGKFSAYNANVKYKNNVFQFSLSNSWIDVSDEIKKGIIQYLMLKSFKNKINPINKSTISLDLYDSFIKNVSKYTPKGNSDSFLYEIFSDLNEKYFNGMLDVSVIKWGKKSYRIMGNYSYGSDTINISKIFQGVNQENLVLLYYVMYHEMLHKKHKFHSSDSGKKMHHTGNFKKDEALFPNQKIVEKKLIEFIRKKKLESNKKRNWFKFI